MRRESPIYQNYLSILKEELIPAGGCTEPIAIAYTAAKARQVLGCMPERLEVYASGNLIKNAMGVYIPNGGKLRGVAAAAVLGTVGGNADRKLEVLLDMEKGALQKTEELLRQDFCSVHVLQKSEALHLIIEAKAKEHREIKYVKTFSLKVTDARNIIVRDGVATAEVIIDSYDVSPFGRIFKYEREGDHEIYEVSFVYYQDKGWVITKLDD